jgi:DNA recombination protein RmuC
MWIPFVIALVVGLSLGAFGAWLGMRKTADTAVGLAKREYEVEVARLSERLSSASTQIGDLRSKQETAATMAEESRKQLEVAQSERVRFEERANRVSGLEEALGAGTKANEWLQNQVTELNTRMEAERGHASEKLALLNEAREQLTSSFKELANNILEEKAQRFTELNRTNIGQMLDPLKTKIQEFQLRVDEVHAQEGRDHAALTEQVRQLVELNQQLSDDANNLAEALQGSSKTLGNWGEMILERILENSGLRKNEEYFIRRTYTRADGTRAQPDAVVLLPEARNLIVDAKASLADYEDYVRATSSSDQSAALQRHICALRAHVNGLSARNYQGLDDLNTPDFVVMFVPIESAFIVALTTDNKLWEEAWKKNVILVSPTSLLFVVRIVANLWTQEGQKRNFQEIARRGAELYDKLVGFVEDLDAVGQRLEQAKDSYDSAHAKLCTGKGNVIRRAEMLRDLGVKPSKNLPCDLVESAMDVPVLPGGSEEDHH